MTSTMTREQAQMYRAAYDGAVKRYSKMTKVQLRNEWLIALSQTGMESLYGGPSSKDELISATLNLRGYTIAKLNEAIHASAHDVTWPDCEWCQNPVCSRCGFPARLDADGRWIHESTADAAFCALVMVR